MAFGGGGGENGNVSSQPNKWEHDQNSHGTHVTSTILGYSLRGTPINGVAPMATVIPVKVLNQNGSGWSSVIARGIVYVADLKAGPLAGSPVVINMSLGGSSPGCRGEGRHRLRHREGRHHRGVGWQRRHTGHGLPGRVRAGHFRGGVGLDRRVDLAAASWWYAVERGRPDRTRADFYIADFSSREKARPGSRRRCARLVGGRSVPVQQRQDVLLLPRRHQHGHARTWPASSR